jgi:hypothetical protein
MPLDPKLAKDLLDWTLGGASPTQPTGRWVQFATASPTTANAFDGPFNTRGTCKYSGAASPTGSATLFSSISPHATATANATPVGWNMYDAAVGGQRLMFGTLAATLGAKSADSCTIQAGATGLKITLS